MAGQPGLQVCWFRRIKSQLQGGESWGGLLTPPSAECLVLHRSMLYPLRGKAPFKGALIGGVTAWTALYGALGRMGVTQVQDPEPKTVLSEFLAHAVYGAVTATIATTLGDEGLFNGQIPWSPIGLRQQLGHGSTSASRQVQIQRRYMTY